MSFSDTRKRAFEAFLLIAFIVSAQYAPYSYASVPGDYQEKTYQPKIVPKHLDVKQKKHRSRCLVESE